MDLFNTHVIASQQIQAIHSIIEMSTQISTSEFTRNDFTIDYLMYYAEDYGLIWNLNLNYGCRSGCKVLLQIT
jgi:hypothetical protein